jgi:hypothetical protein
VRKPAAYAIKRRSNVHSFPAPTGGWIANRNLAQPNGQQVAPGAFMLENMFPTSRGAKIRRGSELFATVGDGSEDVTAIFSYVVGAVEEMFAATGTSVYDITTTVQEVITDQTGGDWIAVQFATSGGIFLVMVNGSDPMRVYDGTDWYPITGEDLNSLAYDGGTGAFTAGQTLTGGTSGATATIVKVIGNATSGTLWLGAITGGPFQDNEALTDPLGGAATANGTKTLLFGALTGVDTSNLAYIWTFKNRLFFIEKESLSAWFLPVDSLTGTASEIPLGGVFNRGGSLLFGSSWSLDSGSGGSGLSQQCIFVTTEGEVVVFQGDNPGDPTAWEQVNTYRIGSPLGSKAHIRAGGDVVIATNIGFVPLSQAIQRDYAALSPSAVSYPIEDAWNDAVLRRGTTGWNCEVWPSSQMVIVAPPTTSDEQPRWFVANARTGAWAPFTNWDATCVHVFKERCFYGSAGGKVIEANVTGLDQGSPYTATYMPLFDDLRLPASLKIAKMARLVIRSSFSVRDQLSFQKDFVSTLPSAPDAAIVPAGSTWGGGVWGTSTWGDSGTVNTYQNWRVIAGSGYAVAPAAQITSGAIVPLDAEVVRMDFAFESADMLT